MVRRQTHADYVAVQVDNVIDRIKPTRHSFVVMPNGLGSARKRIKNDNENLFLG